MYGLYNGEKPCTGCEFLKANPLQRKLGYGYCRKGFGNGKNKVAINWGSPGCYGHKQCKEFGEAFLRGIQEGTAKASPEIAEVAKRVIKNNSPELTGEREIAMNELLELFDRWKYEFALRLNIDYRNVTDWNIQIAQGRHQENKVLFSEQEVDLNLLAAKAYIFLADWLTENNGGY